MGDIEFSDTLFQIILHFHIFGQIQLKIYMLTLKVLKLSGMKFHAAMQPWLKFMAY